MRVRIPRNGVALYPPVMRTAIVADWLYTYGGAEHVLHDLHTVFPDAPFFTTVARTASLGPLKNGDIRTTYLQRLYRLTGNHQILLPLMPRAVESIDLTGYDLVFSSSHAVGKGIIPPPGALHVCYCHTPMRYAWEMEDEYLHDFGIPRALRPMVKRQLRQLRRWDMTTAQRVDYFIANSTTTQERIRRIYGRESVVIPPPVDERFFEKIQEPERTAQSYFLAVSRLVPYKRIDLLIEAANALKFSLKIAGRGQDEQRLRALAGPTVEFLGFVPDADLPSLYAGADAFLFPQYEDAGIVPLEAQACGTPVIAYGVGGALDAVAEGTTGLFFQKQELSSLSEAIQRFQDMQWNRDAIRNHARQFAQSAFRQAVTTTIDRVYTDFQSGSFRRT